MPKTIRMTLNPTDIDMAIKELESYSKSLPAKADAIANALAQMGYSVAASILSAHVFDGDTLRSLTVESEGDGKYVLYAESEAILFVEFGVGARAGSHPIGGAHKGSADGAFEKMGAGTYPGQTHANDPSGWWFPTNDPRLIVRVGEDGQGWGHSFGYTARMPFAMADETMKQDILRVAKEVFAVG